MTPDDEARLLAAWLDGPPGSDPPAELDPDVVEALFALRADLAPAPRVTADDILASITEGPFATTSASAAPTPLVTPVAAAPAPTSGSTLPPAIAPAPAAIRPANRWMWGAGGLGGLAALAAVALITVQVAVRVGDAPSPSMPATPAAEMAPSSASNASDTPVLDEAPPPPVVVALPQDPAATRGVGGIGQGLAAPADAPATPLFRPRPSPTPSPAPMIVSRGPVAAGALGAATEDVVAPTPNEVADWAVADADGELGDAGRAEFEADGLDAATVTTFDRVAESTATGVAGGADDEVLALEIARSGRRRESRADEGRAASAAPAAPPASEPMPDVAAAERSEPARDATADPAAIAASYEAAGDWVEAARRFEALASAAPPVGPQMAVRAASDWLAARRPTDALRVVDQRLALGVPDAAVRRQLQDLGARARAQLQPAPATTSDPP